MTSDEKQQQQKKNVQLLFSLESSNDPLIFLTVLFSFIIHLKTFSRIAAQHINTSSNTMPEKKIHWLVFAQVFAQFPYFWLH